MELRMVTTATDQNPDLGDLYLNDAGDAESVSLLSEEVKQQIFTRFGFFRGEYWRDLLAGTPWFQHILIKGYSDRVVRSVLSQVLLGVPGVASISKLTYTVDGPTRHMEVEAEVRTVEGETLTITDSTFGLFRVDV